MERIYESFQDYLYEEKFSKGYIGTDDDMPDAFWEWLEDIDQDMLIEWADKWKAHSWKK